MAAAAVEVAAALRVSGAAPELAAALQVSVAGAVEVSVYTALEVSVYTADAHFLDAASAVVAVAAEAAAVGAAELAGYGRRSGVGSTPAGVSPHLRPRYLLSPRSQSYRYWRLREKVTGISTAHELNSVRRRRH